MSPTSISTAPLLKTFQVLSLSSFLGLGATGMGGRYPWYARWSGTSCLSPCTYSTTLLNPGQQNTSSWPASLWVSVVVAQPCSCPAIGKERRKLDVVQCSNPNFPFFACSYIADITTSESRTSRISFLYGAINIAFPGANFVSIYIYTYGGYLAIWGTSLALGVLALLYVVFFITDSRGPKSLHADLTEESDDSPAESSGCCSVISNLLECFTVTFMRRNGHKQACLILLLTSMSLFVLSGGIWTSVSKALNRYLITSLFHYSAW